jgi:Ser/Thr protein kinase RdoA (MazF antagonist)
VEKSFGTELDGVLTPFPSYINRVFGLVAQSGDKFAVKFYRPGRWSEEAIRDEHRFLADCRAADIPVVSPLVTQAGDTLAQATAEGESFVFSLFPLKAGRTFEANTDEDWMRLGSLVGRVHRVGAAGAAAHRLVCLPERTTRPYLDELEASGLVTAELAPELFAVLEQGLAAIQGRFDGASLLRVHGDCHAGNILDRGPEGLMLIDFDDMMTGPAVQDLWLLLPDHADACRRELNLLIEGYTRFHEFDERTFNLIEPLRFMRLVYFLLWCARQKSDYDFERHFPDWGSKAFWIREIEDFRHQVSML